MCYPMEVDWNPPAGRFVELSDKHEQILAQDMLLREMRHRVANSLQMIAWILLHKAKIAECAEARLQILDAYGRVMSVAAVQRQLLEPREPGTVRLSDYLSDLSRNLAKLLTDKVKLSVVVDNDVLIESHKAAMMGSIVTELVINAVRHAFPGRLGGRVVIAYQATRSGWALSVSDDGVGYPKAPAGPTGTGYGGKIITALAQQLDGNVEVDSTSVGTRVSVLHTSGVGEKHGY